MKILSLLTAVGITVLGFTSMAHAQTYKLDDGTAEDSYAFGNGTSNTGSIWLNEFSVSGGLNRITSISIAWGNPTTLGNENVNGLPMQALLYSDPNGDGSPFDAVLLNSLTGTIQNVGTNTFTRYTFSSPITVSTANFFVGFYVPGFADNSGMEQYFAAINESTGNLPARSFISANSTGNEPSLTNLSANDTTGSNASFGINGNWLVRADAVPEPSSWAMLGLGLAGTGMVVLRRRMA